MHFPSLSRKQCFLSAIASLTACSISSRSFLFRPHDADQHTLFLCLADLYHLHFPLDRGLPRRIGSLTLHVFLTFYVLPRRISSLTLYVLPISGNLNCSVDRNRPTQNTSISNLFLAGECVFYQWAFLRVFLGGIVLLRFTSANCGHLSCRFCIETDIYLCHPLSLFSSISMLPLFFFRFAAPPEVACSSLSFVSLFALPPEDACFSLSFVSLFAGDWVRERPRHGADGLSQERALVTGYSAANLVVKKLGVGHPIKILQVDADEPHIAGARFLNRLLKDGPEVLPKLPNVDFGLPSAVLSVLFNPGSTAATPERRKKEGRRDGDEG